MDRSIIFEFDGQRYRVPMEAYDYDFIKLPDGRVLEVDGWLESDPPQPMGLTVLQTAEAVVAEVATTE